MTYRIASEMVVLDEAILVLHNLTTQDSGLYKCSAENDHGVTEATAKITVMGKLTEVITTCGRTCSMPICSHQRMVVQSETLLCLNCVYN